MQCPREEDTTEEERGHDGTPRPIYTLEPHTSQAVNLHTVLRHYIADPTASWGLGTCGAVLHFIARVMSQPAGTQTRVCTS
jgi:hypothetical protein